MTLNLRVFKQLIKQRSTKLATVQHNTVYNFLNTLNNFDSAALDLYSKTYNIYSNIKTHGIYFQEFRKEFYDQEEWISTQKLTYHFLALQIDLVEAYCWNMPQVKRINWENFKHF